VGTHNFNVKVTLLNYPAGYTPPVPAEKSVSLVIKCFVNTYTLGGCLSLPDYTVLSDARTDSCITITQEPNCCYDSTVTITGISSALMTGTITNKNTVNLKTYVADKSLAKEYTITV